MDPKDSSQEDLPPNRPDTPIPVIMDLRTPSIDYNHGGLYAPADPKDCAMPGGPCEYCQERIDKTCPDCGHPDSLVSHESQGHKTCNGCPGKLCIRCFFGARYYCPLRKQLPPPSSPPLRQIALGVQSPKAEEKRENK